jgi:formylglycine-generating enzyme required for sulfatase activity
MQRLPKRDWFASAMRRRGPRRTSLPRRGVLLVWPAVLAAVSLPPSPARVALAQQPEVMENSIGMKLVKIPAGEFEMGSDDTPTALRKAGFDLPEAAGPWDAAVAPERPVHRVRITQPFLMGQTEVTQGQWRAVMESAPWTGRPSVVEGPNVAASYLSWDDAVEFCTRLTKLEQAAGKLQGKWRYRLPTEAEWEYACRAGTQTRFSFADDEAGLEDHVWSVANMAFGAGASAQEVGRRRPNPWGLHDMHGNVWEWCGDWYDAGYYVTSPAVDPPGAATGSLRVIRGGSWTALPVRCRSSMRNAGSGSNRDRGVGFRVVCEAG